MASNSASSEEGVFELLTQLCSGVAYKYSTQNRISQKRLMKKMRAHSYEIILKKTSKEIPSNDKDPIVGMLSYYLVAQQSARNVAEYRRCVELKKIITAIRCQDFGESKDSVYSVLKLLVSLSNSIKEDLSPEMYKNPFSFGLLDQMLPKPPREVFGSPQPYSYYPSHVFELPFSLRQQAHIINNYGSKTYSEYTVESFESKSLLLDVQNSEKQSSDVKTYLSPMSLASLTSTHSSPYTESIMNYPRLTEPRDLQIPSTDAKEPHVKISFTSTDAKSDVKEVFRAGGGDEYLDIWELATQIDKNVPDDIWEVASKLPPIKERQLIASSPRELSLWRRIHADVLSNLSISSERRFIRHLMYLVIGIETPSFPFCEESNRFVMKSDLIIEGVSQEKLQKYVADLLLVGTYYKRLYQFAFNHSLEDQFHTCGLVYEAAREVIRRFLLKFRLQATEIYEECCNFEDVNCMPTLLQILYHMEPLKYEIETVVSVYKMGDQESQPLPHGAELMSYLFREMSLVTHERTAHTVFTSLSSICRVYFKFIEKFIFEGELDDRYGEFFIRKDSQYVNARSKRYWDKGFHITAGVAVPDFLRPLAKFILLCGKSLRLLKMCNPNDPLVVLISSAHPSVRCCGSFAALARAARVLDVYRTRCLFVGGPRASFDQMLLKREAERKARADMASIKQAETMDKIVAERKRLAQLIIAEKQHSLRVLEAAMAEAKAAKLEAKQRERRRFLLESEAEKATEEVDARLRDDERDKIMEYYSKLNMEVEKSKIHTEWKIKRLQLDQSRIQLLSTEERNLKREKLELEHQRSEEMAMSTRSDYADDDPKDKDEKVENNTEVAASNVTEFMGESLVKEENPRSTSSDVFSALCNVAKSFFGGSKTSDDKNCDNNKELDAQGNIVPKDTEMNFDFKDPVTSSGVIGNNLDESYDNKQFLKMRKEALMNKLKVMAHEFGQVDKENNRMKEPLKIPSIDEENNVWTPFEEAKRNKLKVLGAEFGLAQCEIKAIEPRTEAQKEALINKQKVLGVEYNLPIDYIKRAEPMNIAQEEALKNRHKVLGSDYDTRSPELGSAPANSRKLALTLNLKPCTEGSGATLAVTPNTGAVTPGELFPRLDLETPTTADIPLDGATTSDVFSPRSECSKDIDSAKKPDREFITSDGFNFPVLVDDDIVESEVISEVHTEESPDNSPSKSLNANRNCHTRHSIFNLLDGSYNLDDFDPFGVKDLQKFSKDHFSSKMDLEMGSSCYTHPAVIMEEVRRKPGSNIFASQFGLEEEKEETITSDNIATLTACLQRSVMLPLTYQLEVVNNSILTYFLVNLDMYEHMRCLKDYFFLMDGEFSRSICHNLFSKLSKTLNPQELLNFATLHNILDKALGSSISHVHKFSENLSFTITDPPLSFQHSSVEALSCLSLWYRVQWPLNIILSMEALMRYARVFHFLLKMRRVSWELGEGFESLKLAVRLSRDRSRKLLRSPQYKSVQIHRHIMASMIRALDNYIVTTCILSSWTEFETDLKKASTLDDLYECHVVYLKKVLFRCLLNNRSTPVMKLLNDIFTVILKFSRVLKAGEWQQQDPNSPFTHTNFIQLEELFHMFEKLARYLHKVIVKLTECGYQRHLAELLAMVNLNRYYLPEEHNVSATSV